MIAKVLLVLGAIRSGASQCAATASSVARAHPVRPGHPRGWATDRGHERKLRSYAVEMAFYQNFSGQTQARVPALLGAETTDDGWLFVLEDLDACGFSGRYSRAAHGAEELGRERPVWSNERIAVVYTPGEQTSR